MSARGDISDSAPWSALHGLELTARCTGGEAGPWVRSFTKSASHDAPGLGGSNHSTDILTGLELPPAIWARPATCLGTRRGRVSLSGIRSSQHSQEMAQPQRNPGQLCREPWKTQRRPP